MGTISIPAGVDVSIAGSLRVTGDITPAKDKADLLTLIELAEYTIPATDWRTWDALATNLPGTAASDDLGLIGGTFGTASPTIQTSDAKATTVTQYARAQIPLPADYQDANTVTLRFHAGMLTTISDGTATLDVECYKSNEEAGISADLCTTAAQSINSLTLADIDFTITPTSLEAGDMLDVRIKIAITDAATGTAVKGMIGAAKLLCDIR